MEANAIVTNAPGQIDIQPLLSSIQEFGDCLDKETTAIKQNDFSNYEELVVSKQQCYANYHSKVMSLARQLEEKKLTQLEKDDVLQSQQQLSEKLEQNDIALSMVEAVSDTMVKLFREAVDDVENQTGFYDSYGNEKARKTTRAASLTFNKEV